MALLNRGMKVGDEGDGGTGDWETGRLGDWEIKKGDRTLNQQHLKNQLVAIYKLSLILSLFGSDL
jgi:hypothetical protein